MDEKEKENWNEEETTKELTELSRLTRWEEENKTEETFEEEDDEDIDDLEDEEEEKPTPKKNKNSWWNRVKQSWKDMPKKKKTAIILLSIFVIVLIIVLITFLVILLKKPEEEKPNIPDVILEMDNYRYENGILIFLDNDKEIGTYECQNKEETLCGTATLTTDDKMDGVKRVDDKKETLHFHSKIYNNRFVFLKDSKTSENVETLLYDIEAKQVVDSALEVLQTPEYENFFILKTKEGKQKLIEFTEEKIKTIVDAASSYDEIHLVRGTDTPLYISVRKDNNSYLANMENKILTKAINTFIVGANEKYIKTKDNNNIYHIYDYNAKEIGTSDPKEYVELLDHYYFYVISNILYLKDYTGHHMMMPITLKNDIYNEMDTVKDNRIIKTEKSFDYQLSNYILNINVHNGEEIKNYTANLKEGEISKDLAYMNYFNGVLYFYTDMEKTNPIGYYNCTNRNEIGENTELLNVCKPAMDSVYRQIGGNLKEQEEQNEGVIPLFLKEYVFIQDGDTIVLVDLTNDKKELARYESVDTTTYTGTMELSLATISNLNFIAKSKTSGKFGVARITNDGIKPIISFNKESILLLGDYYVVLENEKYALYNADGEKISDDRVSKIVDYNDKYMKTVSGSNYFIYPIKGDIVTEKGFDYVELYDDYYAAVLNGKVHVYSYQDKEAKEELLVTEENEPGVELYLTNYDKNVGQVLAFQMRFEKDMIYLKIGTADGNYTKEIGYKIPKTKLPEGEVEEDD